MTCSWPTVTLDECASFQEGYVNPTQKKEHYFDGPVKWLRAVDLNNGSIRNTSRTLSEEGFKSAGKSALLFEPGTLAISKSGTIGRIGILEDYMCGNRAVINIKVDKDKCDNLYIFYVLLMSRRVIETLAVGSVQKNLYTSALGSLELRLPPLQVQAAIAKQLSDLDKKIDLNTQTNQTLEEMAQAIFKSWFVDFDPVKAKMNGKLPEGMDAATASLFPDKLVESELGLIPEGWEIKPIKDLCTKVQNGGTPKRNEKSYWDDGTIPWLTSGEVRQSIITAVENRITQLGLDKSSAKWVPELSTLVALYGATAGEVSLTSIPLTTNQAVCALMPKKEHQWYNYLQLKNRVAELAGKAVGSAQQNISKGLVESTEVLSVPESLLEAFNSQVENLFRLRICNLNENVELAKLRDTLLPKLLSGEIELGTSEELVEAI